MRLILCSGSRIRAVRHTYRTGNDGMHIICQFHHHSAGNDLFLHLRRQSRRKPIVQIIPAFFDQNGRIKKQSLLQRASVLIADVIKKFIFSCGSIADRDRKCIGSVQAVVQIELPVFPLRDIRRIQIMHGTHLMQSILRYFRERFIIRRPIDRILVFTIDHAFIAPVPQIVKRCAPSGIIFCTEHVTVPGIVASENIEPVPEYMRLPVRDRLPERKIGIICFCFHDLNTSAMALLRLNSS